MCYMKILPITWNSIDLKKGVSEVRFINSLVSFNFLNFRKADLGNFSVVKFTSNKLYKNGTAI